ncbi:hypothetical protein CPB83DRAFT_842421 [Crepidotus variabilis]|uniref:NAD(P)-binding protein n=1 Tax=Crepidotus variabilis TaxID=179855 RepID=A0A9P6JX05_9AGAR|nr:hypothetical protein CPB83DRAFT_842421 [Crepidotus variabilis]
MPSIDDSKCVLVTGATSGIGRALSLALAELPSKPKVIGTGRRPDRLEELIKSGVEPFTLELSTDTDNLNKSVDEIISKYPDLDTVILNAGVQYQTDFKKGITLAESIKEINVNYISVLSFVNFILPHFLKLSEQGRPSFIVLVTSGLAIQPAPGVANYSASKAALHSLGISLNVQLKDTNVRVMELIPPLVESELHDAQGTTDKLSRFWMPLDAYVRSAMEGLRKGERFIFPTSSKELFEKFENGKEEGSFAMHQRMMQVAQK